MIPDSSPSKAAMLTARFAIAVVLILVVIKGYAYSQSGSAAVLATLTDSVIDAGISLTMLAALRYSFKPADRDHRHGHGKVEGLAALIQAGFLVGAGTFLGFESWRHFINPQPLTDHFIGISVAALAILLTGLLVFVQSITLKKTPSLIIESDRAHYKSDILLNLSVMAALVIDYQGGPAWLDPALAFLAALYFVHTAWQVGQRGTDMLMDKELPLGQREKIEKIVIAHDQVHGMHDLRTRASGVTVHISFDIEIDGSMSLVEAHEIARQVEKDIVKEFPDAEVLIHKDPKGDTHDTRHRVKGVHY